MAEQLDTRGAVDAYLKDPIPAPSPGQGARLGIALAAGANPDYEAELKKVAQRTGVPIDTVRAYPDEMKRKAQLDALDFDTLAKQFPNTSAFLANVENAKLAHDDVDNLTGIERTVGGTIKDVGVTTLKGVVGLPQAFVGLADLVSGGYAGKGLESIGVRFNETQDILSQMYSPAQQAANRKVQEAQGFFDTIGAALENPSTIATSAWESAPQMLGGAGIARGALRFLPGLSGVVAGAIGEGAISAGSAAEQIRANSKDGLLTGKQALSATASGLGTGTLSFVGGKLAQKLGIGDIDTALATGTLTPKAVDTAHKGFVRKLAESAVTEGLFEELPQSAQEQIWQNFAEDKPIMEGVGNAAAMGFIAGAATGSSFSGVQHIAERRIARAQQAEKTAQAVQQLDTLAAESKLRQRDPATFEQFIAQATKDGPVPDVYISAQALMQSGKAAELAQVSPSIAEQLDAAAATGGDVRIPVAEYAARIAGTELNQGLLDHVKVEPNGMTKAEAQEYLQTQVQQLEQDIQRTLGEQQNDAQFKEQAKAVADQVKAQLDQTGRFTGQVNDTYASLVGNAFAAMASRLGMTAQELYAKYPQRVVGENVAGGGVLNQGVDEYGMRHRPLQPEDSAPLHDLTGGGEIYPADVYSKDGPNLYRTGYPELDAEAFRIANKVKAQPDAEVTIYRAVPATAEGDAINPGDWVTLTKGYAKTHGESLGKEYKILSMKVRADEVFTPGDSIHEWGYWPRDTANVLNQSVYTADTIEVDGKTRPTTNSKGQRIAQTEEGLRNFWKWFGDSKVVDADGKPLVVYHGTQADFNEFADVSGKKVRLLGNGFYFTSSEDQATSYGKRVVAAYLKIENPRSNIETGLLPDDSPDFDGAVATGVPGTPRGELVYVVRTPTQIKSATGNTGAFDPSNPNILNQDARGSFDPATNTISLLKNADLSTYLHELGHFFLEMQFDIAARDGAPDAVVKDSDVLLKWFGVPDMRTWYNLDFEARRAYHEKFAQGFEKYLFEGKAPSLDMQGLFQRFRSWLLRVYRDIKNLNVELTDEVRGVMDRMLATDEQIKVAEQARSMMPLFTSPEQAGLTPEEFQAYQSLGAEATESAQRDLQARGLRDMQWLHNARGREIKKLQAAAKARREDVRSRVRVEVMGQPVYQAWEFLTRKGTDENPASKLDSAAVKALGLPETTTKRLRDFKMIAAEGGLSPDMVAERFGFTSGDHLIQALANAEKPADAVEALTDARMIEQYGDLASPEAIEQAADQAIHNDARSRFVATELNALNTAVGQRKVLASAAREFAQRMVSRIMLRNLRPSQYASAEARAAKAADKAFKSGDIAAAATEKRNQLVNNYATKAAHQAQDDIESGVRYLKKFDKDSVRKNLDAEYLSQIDNLVEKYDLRQQSMRDADKAVSLRTWVQSQLKAGNLPDIAESLLSKQERAAYLAEVQSRDSDGELVYADDEDRIRLLADAIDRSAKRPYKDMTVEEFQGLVDTVKQIEHLGRLKHKILTARDQQAYEQVRDSIAGSIVGNAKSGGKNTRTSSAWLGKKLEAIKQFGASHIKVATWARVMDGGKDNGPVWRYVVQPANERASMETTMRAEATEKLSGILDPILKKVPIADKMGKGKYFPSIGDSLNWQERFAMALNVGNESNLQRLLDGKGWTMQQIKPVLDTLTAEEWNAAQAVWDHFETYRPKIAEKELRVSGKEPEWIPARAIDVETSDGQTLKLRGGYFPVVFDPRVNLKASQHSAAEDAKNLLKASYSAATTQRSFTKARVDEVVGRPLLLNLQGLYSGVNDVIHDLAWHEWVIDANKLLRSKTIDSAIREHYGPEVKKEFERWRDDIVAGSRRLDHAIERAAGWARQSVSASALTFNVMSAAMQPLGLSNSMARIGISWVGKGLSRYISSPIDATKEAQAKSEWMANRTRTRFRELNELRNQVQGQTAPKELMGRYGYWMMMQAQMMVDVPTWWGAYEKAIAGGHDEQTAVNLADQAVKDSQGGGEEVDQSGVERGGPLIKLFTAFYGFMGTTLNTAYLAAKTDTSKAKLAADMALVLMVPAVFGALLKDALTPGDSGDDDPEKLAKKLAAEQATFLLGLVAFGREFSLAVKSLFGEAKGQSYSGPAGLRVIADTGKLAQQAQQGEFDTGFRKSFVTVLGDLSGIPAVQVNRTITGAEALAEDKTANPAALVFGFQEPH